MFNPIAWVKSLIAEEPVLVAWLFNGGIAVLLAYAFHFSKTQEAAAVVILGAVVTIWNTLLTSPVKVSALTSAAATALAALGAFGFHMSPHTIATVVAVASFFLSLLHRGHVSPKN